MRTCRRAPGPWNFGCGGSGDVGTSGTCGKSNPWSKLRGSLNEPSSGTAHTRHKNRAPSERKPKKRGASVSTPTPPGRNHLRAKNRSAFDHFKHQKDNWFGCHPPHRGRLHRYGYLFDNHVQTSVVLLLDVARALQSKVAFHHLCHLVSTGTITQFRWHFRKLAQVDLQ